MRPAHAAAQFISLRAIGSDARCTHRPGAPGGAGVALRRSASSSGARRAAGPSLSRANGSRAPGAPAASHSAMTRLRACAAQRQRHRHRATQKESSIHQRSKAARNAVRRSASRSITRQQHPPCHEHRRSSNHRLRSIAPDARRAGPSRRRRRTKSAAQSFNAGGKNCGIVVRGETVALRAATKRAAHPRQQASTATPAMRTDPCKPCRTRACFHRRNCRRRRRDPGETRCTPRHP
jgi:hypothetical protein